jgi:hypothetical protein
MKHHETPEPASPESVEQGYEVSDMRFKPILIFGIIISVSTVLSMVAMVFFFGALERYAPTSSAYVPSPLAGEERMSVDDAAPIESDPVRDRLAIEGEALQALHEYAWISEEGGIATIPIEDAMALIVKEGTLPVLAPIESIVGPQAPQSGNVESQPVDAVPVNPGAAENTGVADDLPPPVVQE